MDRFIATKNTDNNSFKVTLKSNMDRFIEPIYHNL